MLLRVVSDALPCGRITVETSIFFVFSSCVQMFYSIPSHCNDYFQFNSFIHVPASHQGQATFHFYTTEILLDKSNANHQPNINFVNHTHVCSVKFDRACCISVPLWYMHVCITIIGAVIMTSSIFIIATSIVSIRTPSFWSNSYNFIMVHIGRLRTGVETLSFALPVSVSVCTSKTTRFRMFEAN